MKKLAPLAAALLACGAVHAQTSSVQVFGLLDINVGRYTSTGGPSQTVLGTDGYQSSRLGFRGTEDLGGGYSASFWLESGINPDTGTGGTSNSTNASNGTGPSGAIVFGRRSTVSLSGPFGELRLGRDYTPGFNNLSAFHPFGTNGVGSAGVIFYPVQSGARYTNVRASNSVGYFLPKLGGFYGQAMYAFAEQPVGAVNRDDGRVVGARLGWAAGPVDVAFGYTKTKLTPVGDFTQTNIGGTYDFKVAKLFVLAGENKVGATKTKPWNLGVHVPVGGAGVIRAAYGRVKTTGVANDATQITVGYLHNLSKRTTLYTNVSYIDNRGTGTTYNVGAPVTTPGGNSRGYEAGIRHTF